MGSSELNRNDRLSGILLHVTSLPSYGGIGDFGPEAYAFVDFLRAAKQRLWQVLPLSPTGYGSSPYSALSAFAGNPLLISLEFLVRDGLLSPARIEGLPGHNGPVDYHAANSRKLPLIEEAAANFLDRATPDQKTRFQTFCAENLSWLPDYAMFNVLRRTYSYASWNEWPIEYAHHQSEALERLREEKGRELAIEQVIQFLFSEQWCALRSYSNDREIRILGDVAIFVSYDSADVWTNPEIFELDEQRRPTRVSGVPPDYFSATGQRWGNPLYRWGLLQERGFDWWVARIRRALTLYDTVRLDHFRGFEAFWSIDADEETAINGQWIKAPGHSLFARLKEILGGDLPFVAEDLGLITPEVDRLREDFSMPGMRILQFGFGDRGGHLYLPHRYVPNTVAYTGTHDNNTTLGWWRDDANEVERAAAASVADVCIFPLQDILNLGTDARMNKPSGTEGNWAWRFSLDALHPHFAKDLAALTEVTDRDNFEDPAEGVDAGKPSDEASLRAELGAGV